MSLSDLHLPVSNEVVTLVLLAIVAFWRELFSLVKLLITPRERAAEVAVKEATAFEKLMSESLKTQQQLMTTTTTFTQFVTDTRKRNDEREEKYSVQVRALEKSLIEAQEKITDLNEHIKNLQNIQDKLKADYVIQERLVEEQGKRIQALEASERQAHRLVIEKDLKITQLEKRVKELENEPLPEIKELVDSLTEMKAEPVSPSPGESATPAPGGSESVGQ